MESAVIFELVPFAPPSLLPPDPPAPTNTVYVVPGIKVTPPVNKPPAPPPPP
jgi:hypothetical protein